MSIQNCCKYLSGRHKQTTSSTDPLFVMDNGQALSRIGFITEFRRVLELLDINSDLIMAIRSAQGQPPQLQRPMQKTTSLKFQGDCPRMRTAGIFVLPNPVLEMRKWLSPTPLILMDTSKLQRQITQHLFGATFLPYTSMCECDLIVIKRYYVDSSHILNFFYNIFGVLSYIIT